MPLPRKRSFLPDLELAGIFISTLPPWGKGIGTGTVAPNAASHGAKGSFRVESRSLIS
jgi:hypothetical protein